MDTKLQTDIKKLSDLLEQKKNFNINMIIGVDGFVDALFYVVSKRIDANSYDRMKTITEFGEKVLRASGLSTNFEIVPIQTKLGGNGPILSNALINYGIKLTYVGALGRPNIHPVFEDMVQKSEKVYSLCDPDFTEALEFEDGKVMLGRYSEMNKITWDTFKEAVGGAEGNQQAGPQAIASMIKKSKLFGMENWTMINHMDTIWDGLINEVFPLLPPKSDTLAFFDIADPEKRSKDDIYKAMTTLCRFEEKFKTILGLNEKELYEIAEVFGITIPEGLSDYERLKFATINVYDRLKIYCLVVHPIKEAVCCIDGEYFHTQGAYCKNPVLTTGAGDNFNAGFCLAQSLQMDPQSSLVLGVATSGFYVRNAVSPTYDEQIKFLMSWSKGKI